MARTVISISCVAPTEQSIDSDSHPASKRWKTLCLFRADDAFVSRAGN